MWPTFTGQCLVHLLLALCLSTTYSVLVIYICWTDNWTWSGVVLLTSPYVLTSSKLVSSGAGFSQYGCCLMSVTHELGWRRTIQETTNCAKELAPNLGVFQPSQDSSFSRLIWSPNFGAQISGWLAWTLCTVGTCAKYKILPIYDRTLINVQ